MVNDEVVAKGIYDELNSIAPYSVGEVFPRHGVYKWGVVAPQFMQKVWGEMENDYVWTEKFLNNYKMILKYDFVIIPTCRSHHWFDMLLVNPTVKGHSILGMDIPFILYFDSILLSTTAQMSAEALSMFWNSLLHYSLVNGKPEASSTFLKMPLPVKVFSETTVC
jgi:hypothetical protein